MNERIKISIFSSPDAKPECVSMIEIHTYSILGSPISLEISSSSALITSSQRTDALGRHAPAPHLLEFASQGRQHAVPPLWANPSRKTPFDRQITEDSKRYKKECKILLLGSGESGKSTIVKQMEIIHQGERERVEYRTTVYRNVLDSAGTLARVVRQVGGGVR
ncbi:G-protein alpha subunit-domain-containing protein [Mycena galopus ATCC 62051]|nr:G-protein alpha subunit-domain-containing protein [Mycena galopus ATCC 62051]